MDERAAALHLERLRRNRNRKGADLAPPLGEQVDRLRRVHKRSSGGERAVIDLLPEGLRSSVVSIQISRRAIHVGVLDDGARYGVDRWLRSGERADLLQRLGARSVRVLVAPEGSRRGGGGF